MGIEKTFSKVEQKKKYLTWSLLGVKSKTYSFRVSDVLAELIYTWVSS